MMSKKTTMTVEEFLSMGDWDLSVGVVNLFSPNYQDVFQVDGKMIKKMIALLTKLHCQYNDEDVKLTLGLE